MKDLLALMPISRKEAAVNVAEILQQTGALESISREVGLDSATTQTAAGALLPAILGGFKKQAQPSAGGLGGLFDMMGGLGGGSLLDAVVGNAPTPQEPGNEILGQIFGSKDVSRTVAGQAAQTTGIDPSILKKMLPLLAMAVAGYLSSQRGAPSQASAETQSGGLGSILGQVLGGGQTLVGLAASPPCSISTAMEIRSMTSSEWQGSCDAKAVPARVAAFHE